MSDPYAIFDELVDALEAVRRQQRWVVRLFSVVLIAFLAAVVGLFYVTQDLPRQAAFPDSKFETQVEAVKASVEQATAELRAELAAIAGKLERVEQDVARLSSRLGPADMRAGGGDAPVARADPGASLPGSRLPNASLPGADPAEPNRSDPVRAPDDAAVAPQASVADDNVVPAPLPRPRPSGQTAATPRAGSGGVGDLKPGAQIAPGQFALRPIPDELESKLPRLKGKMFFRHANQIYVVDPKDNKIVEVLKQ